MPVVKMVEAIQQVQHLNLLGLFWHRYVFEAFWGEFGGISDQLIGVFEILYAEQARDLSLKFGTGYFDLGVDAGREDSRSDPTIPKSEYSRAPSASISSKLFEEKLSGRLIIATTDRSDQVCHWSERPGLLEDI